MKTIAFYLPQFHEIPENNIWWGQGFTDWTNTRKAVPLFKGHYQPRQPLGKNFYDLTDIETSLWQASLAKRFGIYGFCYYHYWFNGKLLLERPIQNVLASNEVDLPFCLAWANEPWTRSWDGLNREVLMQQEYGNEKNWADHFHHLIPYLKDSRYIRIEGKPLLVIYRAASIDRCMDMVNLWRGLARQSGIGEIFVVQMLTVFPTSQHACFDASIEFEPMYTLAHDTSLVWKLRRRIRMISDRLLQQSKIRRQGILDRVSYDYIWSRILKRQPAKDVLTFPGAFVNWDNTPRRGTRGLVMDGFEMDKFEKYLSIRFRLAHERYKTEYVFINAWNEWAEGTYLEPDENYGYGYLESLYRAMSMYT